MRSHLARLSRNHIIESVDPRGRTAHKSNGIRLEGREISQQVTVDYPAKYDAEYTRTMIAAELAGMPRMISYSEMAPYSRSRSCSRRCGGPRRCCCRCHLPLSVISLPPSHRTQLFSEPTRVLNLRRLALPHPPLPSTCTPQPSFCPNAGECV